MVPEKVFWKEVSMKGQPDQVIAIEAYRNLPYGIKYMTGLKFTYKSGATNTIGHTHEEPHSKVSFGDDERIVLLEIISGKYGILDITVSNTKNSISRTYLHCLASQRGLRRRT
jgi:hypothetical protein